MWYSITIIVGFCAVATGTLLERPVNAHIVQAMVLGTGWILYLKWYSIFNGRNKELLKPGYLLPEFELESYAHQKVTASMFIGEPCVFLFYRGNWCPLCMAQIKEIADQYKALAKLGVQMVLISPQPHKFSRSLAKKYELGFHFLVDPNNVVAQQLGIYVENGIPMGLQLLGYDSGTVLPTVWITDKTGIIIYADLTDNYRLRSEPAAFLEVINNHMTSVTDATDLNKHQKHAPHGM